MYDQVERSYVSDSNVLQRFLSPCGTAVLADLMPLATNSGLRPAHEIIHTTECTRGEIELEVTFVPRDCLC
jgi:hypothetical protein